MVRNSPYLIVWLTNWKWSKGKPYEEITFVIIKASAK